SGRANGIVVRENAKDKDRRDPDKCYNKPKSKDSRDQEICATGHKVRVLGLPEPQQGNIKQKSPRFHQSDPNSYWQIRHSEPNLAHHILIAGTLSVSQSTLGDSGA
ncbi:Hypothetical predicted protein, partial [Pelobates cultripes]